MHDLKIGTAFSTLILIALSLCTLISKNWHLQSLNLSQQYAVHPQESIPVWCVPRACQPYMVWWPPLGVSTVGGGYFRSHVWRVGGYKYLPPLSGISGPPPPYGIPAAPRIVMWTGFTYKTILRFSPTTVMMLDLAFCKAGWCKQTSYRVPNKMANPIILKSVLKINNTKIYWVIR